MSMRILKVGSANARFAQHEQKVTAECEELSDSICEAIEAVDVDTKNRWTLNGFSTCRVAYVDASAYLPETIAAVATAFRDEGYLVNPMVMEMGGEDPEVDATMTMLAVLWDPEAALGICQNICPGICGSDGEQLPATTEMLNDSESGGAAGVEPEGTEGAEPEGVGATEGGAPEAEPGEDGTGFPA